VIKKPRFLMRANSKSRRYHFRQMGKMFVCQVFTCFLPKSRASMDHAPGPIIAVAPLSVARAIGIHGSFVWVIAIESWMMKISAPTIGVQRPIRSSIAAHTEATRWRAQNSFESFIFRRSVTDSRDGTLPEKSHGGHANNLTGHRFAGLGASHY
jgi:hypothetical protein